MNDVKELLEKHYQSFIHEEMASTFFLGLADYLKFAYKNPYTKALIDDLKKQQIAEYAKVKEMEDKAIQELDNAEKTLRKIQSKQVMDAELASVLFEQYKEYRTNKRISSATQPVEMERVLFETAVEISKKDPKYVKQFLDLNPERPNVYGNYKFSDSLKLFLEQKASVAQNKTREIWAALYYLTVIAMVVMKGRPEFDDMYSYEGKTQYQINDEGADYFQTEAEWNRLGKTRIDIKEFAQFIRGVRSYPSLANRLHLYLLTGLTTANSKPSYKIDFDENKSILSLNDIKIKLKKFGNEFHLMELIIDEPYKEWFYSELAELYDDTGSTKDKKFSNAAYELKDKIIKATNTDDLIITTSQSVQFNPKYQI